MAQFFTKITARVAGMGLMGLGGRISIAGGFLFIYICYRAIWHGLAHRAP